MSRYQNRQLLKKHLQLEVKLKLFIQVLQSIWYRQLRLLLKTQCCTLQIRPSQQSTCLDLPSKLQGMRLTCLWLKAKILTNGWMIRLYLKWNSYKSQNLWATLTTRKFHHRYSQAFWVHLSRRRRIANQLMSKTWVNIWV